MYLFSFRRMFALLERTVTRGESNSALLVGPRGCGKTMASNMTF
jgi:replication-associated recombination protein RarA